MGYADFPMLMLPHGAMLHAVCNMAALGNLHIMLSQNTMLHAARNMTLSDNNLLREGVRTLGPRLPYGWTLGMPKLQRSDDIDATAKLTAPDGRSCELLLEAKARLEPKQVQTLFYKTAEARERAPLIVIARYLSEGTRQRLRAGDVGYLDLTGNIRITVSEPGLYIETQGANEDPDREERPARSLRGPKAGRIVRMLIERKVPPGVRELATLTGMDPGYVSRVLALLDSEALITRKGHGRMQSVDWPALLRFWAKEAPLEARGVTRTYLEPRGLSALLERLAKSEERYVVTGSLGAAKSAPVAAPRFATVWMSDAMAAADRLRLRAAEAGANVLLIEPNETSVFEGALQREGVWYAAPSLIAADLLSSPGRGPAEGEELIRWMQANEEQWRI